MENRFRSPRGTQGTVLVERDPNTTATIDVPKSGPVNLDEPALVGLTEPVLDQRFALKPGKTTVGRRADSDVILPHGSVSSLHAWVIQDKDGYRVMNILSTNGTFVNDQRITETVVQHGDRIRFGGVEMQLHTGMEEQAGAARRRRMRWLIGLLVVVMAAAAAVWVLLNT